ncbi:MAG: WxcM-like domain-containing protein [Bacteroidales bacterium]|nr:WxcM-like domain-containing protein [Bacteroidales bacterium]
MKLKDKIAIIERKKLSDSQGWFLKVIDGKESGLPAYTGEIYLTHASGLGQVRGNHYHDKAKEWFTLLEGNAELKLMDMETKEVMIIALSSDDPKTIVIPPSVAHAFINTAEEPFLLLAYTDELYDPKDTIPYSLY